MKRGGKKKKKKEKDNSQLLKINVTKQKRTIMEF